MLPAHRYKSCYCLLLGCSHISITYLLTTVSSTWLWLCIIKVDWLIVNMIDQLLHDQLLMLRTYHRLPVHKLSVIYQSKKLRIIIIKSVLYTYHEGWVREGGWINLCNSWPWIADCLECILLLIGTNFRGFYDFPGFSQAVSIHCVSFYPNIKQSPNSD